jgi:hypothetical protein
MTGSPAVVYGWSERPCVEGLASRMISDTNPWAVAAKRVAALTRPDRDRAAPPPPDVVADALRVLVWLAGERAAPPHVVRAGPHGTISLSWRQGASGFEVEVLSAGRLRWAADAGDEATRTGRRLDKAAADLLRSLIPITRPFHPPRDPVR